MVHDEAGELRLVLEAARTAVDAHWKSRRQHGHNASEDELTVALCEAASPRIEYAQFSTRQEGRLGADWLWWFLDQSDECFGMLVQAKRLFRRGASDWFIDFGYHSGERPQINKLLDAADRFEVPAAYVLYCGDVEYRAGLSCGRGHTDEDCARCVRYGVAVLGGPCAKYLVEYGGTADVAFRRSLPLEDLVGSTAFKYLDVAMRGEHGVFDLNLNRLSDDLRKFLLSPQSGARQIAKALFAQAVDMRIRHAEAAVADRAPVRPQRVFPAVPLDRGHFGLPYYDHLFRGLRRSLPDAVRSVVLDGQAELSGAFADLGGVLVVHV